MQFVCDICNKECNTKQILNNHHKKDHKGKENMSDESEDVSLKKVRMEEEVKCVTEEEKVDIEIKDSDVLNKVRFKETTDERPLNDQWLYEKNKIDEEEVLM